MTWVSRAETSGATFCAMSATGTRTFRERGLELENGAAIALACNADKLAGRQKVVKIRREFKRKGRVHFK